MRTILLMAILLACGSAQPRRAVIQGPRPEHEMRRSGHVRPPGGFVRTPWWVWPGGWWSNYWDKPLPPPVEPEEPLPAVVKNPHYQAERLLPEVRDFPDGSLPFPKVEREEVKGTPCTIREASGRTLDARECRVVDDWVVYVTADGRRHRATLDIAAPVPLESLRTPQ